MGNLIRLILRNGGFVTFVLLELLCLFLTVQFNTRQQAIFSHTAGLLGGQLMAFRQQWSDYTDYKRQRDEQVAENKLLLEQIAGTRLLQIPYRDTFFTVLYDSISRVDSIRRKAVRPEYRFLSARVLSNSVSSPNNWLMINRGESDGVKPNMGIVTAKGPVGIIRHTSQHFSIVMSMLHRQMRLSVALPKHENAFGSLIWEGGATRYMTLKYIPKHFDVKDGEQVVTSGFSGIFPKGIAVGIVEGVPTQDRENPYFLQIRVRLSQDLSTADFVQVVENLYQVEIDSLKQRIQNDR